MSSHIAQFHRPDTVKAPLYVITPVFNPIRFRSRWKLYKQFEKMVLDSGAYLYLIEASFGNRDEVFIETVSERHVIIHVRMKDEIWVKENLINRAIQSLPASWEYVAWIDSDVQFARPDWVGETLQQLQHYQIVQMFSQAIDLSPDYEVVRKFQSFMCSYTQGLMPPEFKKTTYYGGDGIPGGTFHPGFAWAARKEAINHLGGLIDWSILGGGDLFMAYALIGALSKRQMPESLGTTGIRWINEWQNRAEKHIKRNVGVVKGLVLHYWHGKKENRRYKDRGQILVGEKFNPELDLKRDWQGLWQLTDRNFKLRDRIREYFRQRNEDGIDV